MAEYSNFTQNTELTRENYNSIYIQEPVNSRVVEFCVVLASVTNLHDHFGLYSLTGSISVFMSMFALTAISGIGQTPCSFEHYLVLIKFCKAYFI